MKLNGKVAIVSGAAKGIGKGVAMRFVEEGAKVAMVDRDGIVDDLIRKLGEEKTSALKADISVSDDRDNIVNSVIGRWGRIDILVNNAGMTLDKSLVDTTREDFETVIRTNLEGSFFLTQLVVSKMIELGGGGCVLFTTSTHAKVVGMMPVYSASKAALETLVQEAALELAGQKIRVNAVAPGVIAIHGQSDLTSQDVPMGRLGTPEDVAGVMAFLASDEADYITGSTIVVDGGFSLMHHHYYRKKGFKIE